MFLKHIQTKSNNVLTDLFKRYLKEKKQTVKWWVIHDRLSLLSIFLRIFKSRSHDYKGPKLMFFLKEQISQNFEIKGKFKEI